MANLSSYSFQYVVPDDTLGQLNEALKTDFPETEGLHFNGQDDLRVTTTTPLEEAKVEAIEEFLKAYVPSKQPVDLAEATAEATAEVSVSKIYNHTAQVSGTTLWTTDAVTDDQGQVVVFPSDNGASDGIPLFKTIIFATATTTENVSDPSQVYVCSVKQITPDCSKVVFNIVSPGSIGSAVPSFAKSGITVKCLVLGL